MAPPNKASMAAGPALKLVHCTLTCGPMALSKKPLALPTMACACVMLGNAPTRIVVCAGLDAATPSAIRSTMRKRLLTLLAPDNHGQNAAFLFFFLLGSTLAFGGTRGCAGDEIRKSGVFQNLCSRVAHVEKHLIERAVRQIAVDEHAQLFGVGKRRHRAVDQTHDLAQGNVRGLAAQLVAALGSADALNHARVLQFEENEFQEF